MPEHKSIGHLLLEQGTLTETQLNQALSSQQITGKRLGDILVDMDFATEEQVVSLLSEQMGLAYIDLSSYQIEQDVLDFIDSKTAHKLKVLPIFKIENTLTVVMVDPLDLNAVDELTQSTSLEIQPVFGTKIAILEALNKYYPQDSSKDLEEAVEAYHASNYTDQNSSNTDKNKKKIDISKDSSEQDAPAIKFVNLILSQAVNDGASDIHFEPDEDSFSIRCRIDGILHSLTPPPKTLQNAIISRLKVLANLDIAEKRVPQDGRVQINISDKTVDLRVSSFPTIHGENIVIRILDKSMGILSLDKIGIQQAMLSKIEDVINLPNGIILVTGPTGSGKTTTLYSFLNKINSEDKNIMTLEDPVEYQIKGIRQAHVDVKAGLTFEIGLRSLLRQDPDVIMIGEVRDLKTAQIAIQSALTGHLVFSTLHTNDSASTITRLIDMGIEPFLVSSSLSAIVAQRLIRRLCPNCKKEYKPDSNLLERLELPNDDFTFYEANGCENCRNTGYKGRMGIYELLVPTEEIKHLINKKSSSLDISEKIIKEGFITLRKDGIDKVIMGETSITEVLRIS